jgi:phosphatidylglycerophosphatase A
MSPPGRSKGENRSAQRDGPTASSAMPPGPAAPRRPNLRFMLGHPARLIALGFGSGLAPKAPGTAGTLFAWAVYAALERWVGPMPWPALIAGGTLLGVWACGRCARDLGLADPGSVVWDEIVAFWAVLAAIAPAGAIDHVVAFALFRLLDAAKPGPVGWADRWLKAPAGAPIGWAQGAGILLDDAVAATGTVLLVLAARGLWT